MHIAPLWNAIFLQAFQFMHVCVQTFKHVLVQVLIND